MAGGASRRIKPERRTCPSASDACFTAACAKNQRAPRCRTDPRRSRRSLVSAIQCVDCRTRPGVTSTQSRGPSLPVNQRLRALPTKTGRHNSRPSRWGGLIYRSAVLLLLALITHAVGKPTAVERCIDDRMQQVLDSHQLKPSQLTASVRVSEVTKATNFCNGGNGRLNWSR